MNDKDFNPMGVELDNDESFVIGTTITEPPTKADYTDLEATAIDHLISLPPAQVVPDRPTNKNHPLLTGAPIGEVTSDVAANVYAYHMATSDGKLVFLNIAGSRAGVESIRAKLAKGESCHLHNLEKLKATPMPLKAGDFADGSPMTGMFKAFGKYIGGKRVYNAIMVHEDMTAEGHGFSGAFYIYWTSNEQAIYVLKAKLEAITGLAIYDQWLPYLWQAGRISMNVRECRHEGEVKIFAVMRDADSWKRLIAGGIANGIITLPAITTTIN
jgi:hypothetical protein